MEGIHYLSRDLKASVTLTEGEHTLALYRESTDTTAALGEGAFRTLLLHLMHVCEAMGSLRTKSNGASLRVPLSKAWSVEVRKKEGEVLCSLVRDRGGFLKNPSDQGGEGLTFTDTEWWSLEWMLRRWGDRHQAALGARRDFERRQARPHQMLELMQYRWCLWGESGIRQRASGWFFSDETCLTRAAEFQKQPDRHDGRVEIESRSVGLEVDEALVTALFVFLVRLKVEETRDLHCQGCKTKSPDPLAHDDGCLMSPERALETHLDAAATAVTQLDLLRLVRKLQRLSTAESPRVRASFMDLLLRFVPPPNLAALMSQEYSPYHELLSTCHNLP